MILLSLLLMGEPGFYPVFYLSISASLLLSISLEVKKRGIAVFSFLPIFLVKMAFDIFGYKMGVNPWPRVFGWYCNPAYRLLDF